MSNLLEISQDHIAQLGDAELRELIGLLCEADYRLDGLTTSGITWGGHQDARDGGLDVVVWGDKIPPSASFIPRSKSGFQVKKPDMPPAEIRKEMRPDGALRDEILNLIREGGAYLIVSSTGSTTNTSLKNRRDAMRDAVASEQNHQNLYLDFFDRGRIATWVRSHPSLILWVRNKIGRPLTGWRPYENWANIQESIEEEYLLDNGLRLHDSTMTENRDMSIEDGMLKLRTVLSTPGESVRLVGLSGVGKTRFVQALFDNRIGEQPLNRSHVYYTDISNGPDPIPQVFAEQLIANGTRAILVVDNCPPELHRRLTQICSMPGSNISLITIEYDVREDLPDETHVFRLEPSSEELIEKLVRKRFGHITPIDALSIENFSGGNARIAIALANTVRRGETLSGFHDEELFERLFWQRHSPNETLIRSAELCSLVYSFDGQDTTLETSELKFLASLIGKTANDLHRDVLLLKERDLVQKRDIWRAVLPHAIANRLAKRALEAIPKDILLETFLNKGTERLIISFARRLSFLHDSDVAIEIASSWLAPGGWIGKVTDNLNDFGIQVFRHLAPVVPERALEAIERASNGARGLEFTSRQNYHYADFVRLLRHLAYDAALFTRSVNLLCRFALSENATENVNSTRDVLKSLFYIHLSGTHATARTRSQVIERLLSTEDSNSQQLGILLLNAALESWHFSSWQEFSFGARRRDYGYWPVTLEEIHEWYKTFIDLCVQFSHPSSPVSVQIRTTLAGHLRGLWTNIRAFSFIEEAARHIHEQQPWSDGWLAIKGTIHYDGNELDNDTLLRLRQLEEYLKPDDLLSRAHVYALSTRRFSFELEEEYTDDSEAQRLSVLLTTQEIGSQVAQNKTILEALLPDIVASDNPRLDAFGRGLANGSADKSLLWQLLYAQYKQTEPEKRCILVLIGFLAACSESDPDFYSLLMDDLITDDPLSAHFPRLQIYSQLDSQGISRLLTSLDVGIALPHTYEPLAWGRKHEALTDDELATLIRKISVKDNGGMEVALPLLMMRFFKSEPSSSQFSEVLLTTGREVLRQYPFTNGSRSDKLDHELASIAKECLKGYEGRDAAISVCSRLAETIAQQRIYSCDYPEFLCSVALLQPTCFLDVFLGTPELKGYRLKNVFSNELGRHSNPLNLLSDDELIAWCDISPVERYPAIAGVINTYSESKATKQLEWTPLVYRLFEKAPDLKPIVERIGLIATPMMWSNSKVDLLQKRSVLFESLFDHNNEEIRSWARSLYSLIQEDIRNSREWEKQLHRERTERFE